MQNSVNRILVETARTWIIWNVLSIMLFLRFVKALLCPARTGWGIMDWQTLSVRLSVLCLTLSQEWRDMRSWKLTERKPMTWVSIDPFTGWNVTGQGNKATSYTTDFTFKAIVTAGGAGSATWRIRLQISIKSVTIILICCTNVFMLHKYFRL